VSAAVSRRALIGGAGLAATVAAVPIAASVTAAAGHDARWAALVADFRQKFATWLAYIDVEDEQRGAFYDAAKALGPKPQKPWREDELPAWKREHAVYAAREAELRERIMGPAEAIMDGLSKARGDAFKALCLYPVRSLADLAEKIKIVAADYDGAEVPLECLTDFLADVRGLDGEARA